MPSRLRVRTHLSLFHQARPEGPLENLRAAQRFFTGGGGWPDELIGIHERWRGLEVLKLLRGNDVVRLRREGYSALLRAGQISPGQSARRQPHSAALGVQD